MKSKKIITSICFFTILLYTCIALLPNNGVLAGTLSDNIDGIDEARYPGYKNLINNLKNKYPGTYNFKLYYTGVDWNTAITAEYQGHKSTPLNLFNVGNTYTGKWYCPICGTKKFDNGSLCCASRDAIGYMLDPRNSITEASVFQFKLLEEPDVEIEDLNRVVQGTFLANAECVQAIYDASRTYNINGYYLVAKMINEHGRGGTALSSGNGTGFYNYFNIGSFGNSTSAIINNGLNYARNKNWNSPRASILGGAEIVKNSYINERGQNTLYFQKFNFAGKSEIATYQYQQNIMAAESQGRSLKDYYNTATGPRTHTFIIPVYENMPQTAVGRPDTSSSSTLNYEEGNVTNVRTALTVRVGPSVTSKKVGKLNNGESIKILERASAPAADGYLWDLVVSNLDGTYGYAARIVGNDLCLTGTGEMKTTNVDSQNVPNPIAPPPDENNNNNNNNNNNQYVGTEIKVEGNIIKTIPTATANDILKVYPNANIKNRNGENLTPEKSVGTGYKAIIDGTEYTICKRGDVNGDSEVDIQDWSHIINYLKRRKTISAGVEFDAARVANEAEITISDAAKILNYLKRRTTIDL